MSEDNSKTTHVRPIDEIRSEKMRKLDELKALDVNPYPNKPAFDIKSIQDITNLPEGTKVAVAGRIKSIRHHGGISFLDIEDKTDLFQAALKKESFDEKALEIFNLIDPSDFIEVRGGLFTTKSGQKTIDIKDFNVLSKAIRPVPDKPGEDKEVRIRRRYLDILTNPQSKKVFETRHLLTKAIRHFLDGKGITEVETPILQPLYGGANAKPFTTHINALDATAYLRIAPELYLKRLIVAGLEGVYELAKDFRNEGIDQTHFPEFTMLELYISYIDYHGMMDLLEELFQHISQDVLGKTVIQVHDNEVNLSNKWERIAMTDLIKNRLDINATDMNIKELKEFSYDKNLEFEPDISKGELIFTIFDKLISKTLLEPTWVIDYPAEVSPLSKPHATKEGFTERFELYIGGVELADGWSELTDPIEQRARFEAEHYRKFEEDESPQPLDEDFLEAIEYGLPPFAGVGIGIDRLTMFFTNTWSIQDTILFPFKKPVAQNEPIPSATKPVKTAIEGLPTREEATKLLEKHVYDNYQHLHAKMVASVLEAYAKKFKEDENLWYITGLLHDLDFNDYPDEHPHEEVKWFKQWGYPQALIHAVLAHAPNRTNVTPQTRLARALMATDEISGVMYAYALLRPEGFDGMKVKSLKKKLKDRAFAPNIPREEIQSGIDTFTDVTLEEHLQLMIETFQNLPELKEIGANKHANQEPNASSTNTRTGITDTTGQTPHPRAFQIIGTPYQRTKKDGSESE